MTVKPAALSTLQTIVLPISRMSPADGAGHGHAEAAATSLGLVELWLQHGHDALHGLGALDQLGEKELALAEEVADLFGALDETVMACFISA